MLEVTNNRFTVEDMCRFAGEAWGPLGVSIVDQWCAFNAAYFDGVLRPVPLVITACRRSSRMNLKVLNRRIDHTEKRKSERLFSVKIPAGLNYELSKLRAGIFHFEAVSRLFC